MKTDLQREFGEFGHVTDIELPLTAKGVAFVEFDSALDAADAQRGVTGRKLKGMVLKVKMAEIQKGGNTGSGRDGKPSAQKMQEDEPPRRARSPERSDTRKRQEGSERMSRRSRSRGHRRAPEAWSFDVVFTDLYEILGACMGVSATWPKPAQALESLQTPRLPSGSLPGRNCKKSPRPWMPRKHKNRLSR